MRVPQSLLLFLSITISLFSSSSVKINRLHGRILQPLFPTTIPPPTPSLPTAPSTPDQSKYPPSASLISTATTQPGKLGEIVAIVRSVGLFTLGAFAALAFLLVWRKVKHANETQKLVNGGGDGVSRRFVEYPNPPTTSSTFLCEGTVNPSLELASKSNGGSSGQVNSSPYRKLNSAKNLSKKKRNSAKRWDRSRPSPPLAKPKPSENSLSALSASSSSPHEECSDTAFYSPRSAISSVYDMDSENIVPEREPIKESILLPMARRGGGSKGQCIQLRTNHLGVNFTNPNGHFFHYSVAITYEDGRPVEAKGIGRNILEKVQETHQTDLGFKYFAYDGEKSLFTVGALPRNKLNFSVVPEDRNVPGLESSGRPKQSKKFMVEISYAAKIPMQAIASALEGKETDNLQDAIRVLDIILRQSAARQGFHLVRQSFFPNLNHRDFLYIVGGVVGIRGFYSSFRTTQGGLFLNFDTSTTMIVRPGPILDFLLSNQNVDDPYTLDWNEARRALKNLRVWIFPSGRIYKISGLSEKLCKDQMFTRIVKNEKGEVEEVQTTVYKYFTEFRKIPVSYSDVFPCINVGKPERPTYFPMELCILVNLQRYNKSLTNLQRASLVEKSRQNPVDMRRSLTNGLMTIKYNADPVLQETGVSIDSMCTLVNGRVLPAPKLKVGNGEDFLPSNGRWNFNNKKLVEPATVTRWAVVNFSARCDTNELISDLIRCGKMKGINIEPQYKVFQEDHCFTGAPANIRVDKMFEQIQSEFSKKPNFLLCILSERKNSLVYGPWKKKNLVDFGIVTQCIAPTMRVDDQYITNVLLKINAKLGGLNSLLAMERSPAMPLVTQVPTIIVGMDVSHGSPGLSDIPSVAAVVSSRQWPLISKYKACVRTQPRKVEMIDNLFKLVSDKDEGMFRELLIDFYSSSGNRKPDHIIIFRDGVSESQFNQVLNTELDQIMQACKFLEPDWTPKFTVIISQKNHHTKFFKVNGDPDNVPPGTIIDSRICHPRNNDFYLCSHAGMIGTTRPTHYHVLFDQIGFSTDDLQELVHSLSYVSQRSTTAISVVAPICYAHLAAAQMATVMKFEDMSLSKTLSKHDGITTPGAVPVPPMPTLHPDVASSMFFC